MKRVDIIAKQGKPELGKVAIAGNLVLLHVLQLLLAVALEELFDGGLDLGIVAE